MTTLTPLLLGDLNNPAPRITYYDDASGERIELSTVTLANWAAKTANMLRDEFGAGPGSTVTVRLPAHWQTAGVLLGIWWAGAEVVFGAEADASDTQDVAFCTPGDEPLADEVCVLSLDAFGRPVPNLPLGLTDYSTAVRVHGDRFTPAGAGPALNGRSVEDVADAAREAAAALGITAEDRVLSTGSWETPEALIANLLAVLIAGASVVQVANPDPAAQERRVVSEKVTKTL
ncbi:TIGR03089 family protein [Mycobacterium sp. CBMA271]|uniref:TIGR03089 family protein n=1 Tax=unclassified Mycobacteroides TaxID=2618759 RepID=UPI0012DD4FB4|nr:MULTISPECIES: TIGR03089 family protein [unclassified Mycobacteroides]MUM16453.1 TIGR03089 family protein [Mycobacteroides sp. CBMA 326]MUM20603.1 TIGR03089 family protein [Mycobacteroides sp. CBMA 271]